MRVEDDKLIIDSNLSDDMLDEFLDSIKQDQIEKIVVGCDDIASSIIQVLWCVQNEKKVKVKVDFLEHFFENVTQRSKA